MLDGDLAACELYCVGVSIVNNMCILCELTTLLCQYYNKHFVDYIELCI